MGRYRLVRRVGSGAFATVWLAHDDVLDVPVAVKVLADNWTHRQDIRERFLQEARLLRRLDEGRAVRVYDIGELDDGRPYFVMDYADGGSLEDLLRSGTLDLTLAVTYAVSAAHALSALHRHGVVHRDVTPGNLLLRTGRDGAIRLVIADLGMAKALAEASGLTQVAGTPAYMAPEQAGGQGGFDARADVYALGAVTYTLLTGQPPFDFKTVSEVMGREPALAPAPPSGLRAGGVPGPVEAVVLRALAHDRNARWQSATEFAEALQTAYNGIRRQLGHHSVQPAGWSAGPTAEQAPGPGPGGAPVGAVVDADPSMAYWDPESLVVGGMRARKARPAVLLGWAVLGTGSLLIFATAFYTGWWLFS